MDHSYHSVNFYIFSQTKEQRKIKIEPRQKYTVSKRVHFAVANQVIVFRNTPIFFLDTDNYTNVRSTFKCNNASCTFVFRSKHIQLG